MRHITWVIAVLVVFFLGISLVYSDKENPTRTHSRLLMGTLVDIAVKPGGKSNEQIKIDTEKAFKEIERLEALLSRYKSESDVSRINASAGKGPVWVSKETTDIIGTALMVSEASGGAFDPTIHAVTTLWDFTGGPDKIPDSLPTKYEIEERLRYVDYTLIKLDRSRSKVELSEGMSLDLGGVAKGYIVSRAVETLKKLGYGWIAVRAGGDMVLYKDTENKKPFTIGVQHPRDKDKVLGKLTLEGGAIATSGDYARSFVKDGTRYHHILDPRNGYPTKGVASVTIVTKDPTLADALSTAVFVLGVKKGLALVERLGEVEALIVDSEEKVHTSSGLKDMFEAL